MRSLMRVGHAAVLPEFVKNLVDYKTISQAVLALARRRVNVLWAMLRDGQPYEERAPLTALAA